MCDLTRPGVKSLLVLSAAFAMLLPPDEVTARQTTPQTTAEELQTRLDELRPQRDAAREAAEARKQRDAELLRSAAAAVATVDTIHVGLMTIITPVDQVDTARELFTEVWDESYAAISTSTQLSLARFSFQWARERVPIHIEEHARPIENNSRWIRRENVKRTIREAIAATINYDLSAHGSLTGRWVTGNPLLAQGEDRIYRMVATSRSRSTRACLEGVASECVSALELTMPQYSYWRGDASDEELVEAQARLNQARQEHLEHWYTPQERRALAARGGGRLYGRDTQEVWSRCADAGDIAACDQYLLWQPDIAPLAAPVRESFLAYALEQGGTGAWSRLLEDPQMPAIDAIEYAAGQPIDDLAIGWISQITDHKPETFAGLVPNGGLALLWFVFFSAFAMRSTRWRLG